MLYTSYPLKHSERADGRFLLNYVVKICLRLSETEKSTGCQLSGCTEADER